MGVKHGFAMVLHLRGAERDSVRMLKRFVPRHWKMHIHSFRGTLPFLDSILNNFDNAYIGVSGLITMFDGEVQLLCERCPIDRMILETDAPYLPLNGTYFSHPGQIPLIAQKVEELQGGRVSARS